MSENQTTETNITIPRGDWNVIKKGLISGIIVWLFTSIITGIGFYYSMTSFKEQQAVKNKELTVQIDKLVEDLKTKVSQKDLENYTSSIKVQLNSITNAVENNNRQQDNMFNYLLNKPSR